MIIKVTKKENIEVDIADNEVINISINQIRKVCGYPKDWFIKDGFICEEIENYGSHVWYETVRIRPATEFDEQVYRLVRFIKENTQQPIERINPPKEFRKKGKSEESNGSVRSL